jgi:hypothetical protein
MRWRLRSRLSHKKIFILDEISMVILENLVQINERCNAIWDLNRYPIQFLVGYLSLYFRGILTSLGQSVVMLYRARLSTILLTYTQGSPSGVILLTWCSSPSRCVKQKI